MQLEDAIKKRKSVRRYSDKKPDWRKIIRAIDAARYAPTAGGIDSVRFIIVQDKEKIKELAEASQQDFIAQAQYVVVVISLDVKVKRFYEEFGEKFARQQAGAAIENFLLKLTADGLATCWIGYFAEDQVKRILSIPDKAVVEALFPIGFETKVKTSSPAKPLLENILWFDKFKNKYMEPKTRVGLEQI